MKSHHLYHLLSELLFLAVIVCPIAVVFAVLIGLGASMFTGPVEGLNASWISFCAVVSIVPLAVRACGGPDTRVICEECMAMAARSRRQGNQHRPHNDRRRHFRHAVNFHATFTNDRLNSFGMISDLSAAGCRVKIAHPCSPGTVGKIVIQVPGGNGPLTISRARVRWVTGHECGFQFGRLAQNEQRWLNHILRQSHMSSLTQFSEGKVPVSFSSSLQPEAEKVSL